MAYKPILVMKSEQKERFSLPRLHLAPLNCKMRISVVYLYLISKKNVDINEHERIYNITPRRKVK